MIPSLEGLRLLAQTVQTEMRNKTSETDQKIESAVTEFLKAYERNPRQLDEPTLFVFAQIMQLITNRDLQNRLLWKIVETFSRIWPKREQPRSLVERANAWISLIQSKLYVSHPVEIALQSFIKHLEKVENFSQVIGLELELAAIEGILLRDPNVPSHLRDQFLIVCDRFCRELLTRHHWGPFQEDTQNIPERMAMAARIKALASRCSPSQLPLLAQFQTTDVTAPSLLGKRMDPGRSYEQMDARAVKDNQVQLSRRTIPGEQIRTEMAFQLTNQTRKELSPTLEALQNAAYVQELQRTFNTNITVTPNVALNYEVSTTDSTKTGIPAFKTSNVQFGNMLKIELKDVGEIYIGQEPPNGRYIAHHTVFVRVFHPKGSESSLNTEEQLQKMHQLLSIVGLSQTLAAASEEEDKRNQVLCVIETYLPHLAFAIQNSAQFANLSADDLIAECVQLLPRQERDKMNQIFAEERKAGVQKVTTPFGNKVIKLSGVAERFRQAGGFGFFVGVTPTAAVSILKNGFVSAHMRNYAGFERPSTCHQDALAGGNEAIFLRAMNRAAVSRMEQGNPLLHAFPYINCCQIIVSPEVINFPHNAMHHNTYGLRNPRVEILNKEGSAVEVSGVDLLQSDDIVAFTEKESQEFHVDNEVMIRTGALPPTFIKKIIYQDPRKALRKYLEKKAPLQLLQSLDQAIIRGGHIEGELKEAIWRFLQSQGLFVEKKDAANNPYLSLKDFNSEYNFGNSAEALLKDNRKIIIDLLISNKLVDEDNRVFGSIPLDQFLIESTILKQEFFE